MNRKTSKRTGVVMVMVMWFMVQRFDRMRQGMNIANVQALGGFINSFEESG